MKFKSGSHESRKGIAEIEGKAAKAEFAYAVDV
jgi:hypothetical protein